MSGNGDGSMTVQTTLTDTGDSLGVPRSDLEDRLKELCFEELPPIAKADGWPIVFDHCIARVCYDCACGDVWYDAVGASPFYSEATDRQLRNAIGIAIRMKYDGVEYVARQNERSLIYRGELDPQEANHVYVERQ